MGADVEYGSIEDGTNDKSLEAFINIPLGSSLAATGTVLMMFKMVVGLTIKRLTILIKIME